MSVQKITRSKNQCYDLVDRTQTLAIYLNQGSNEAH